MIIAANARDDVRLGSESVRVIGEVCGSSAQLRAGLKQVPQHFADANNPKVHDGASIPNLIDAELVLDLLQRHALCFWHPQFYPNQLQDHHASEK